MDITYSFIVDESAGFAVVQYLQSIGYDVLSVSDAMFQADDVDILSRAVHDNRIVVTNDKDFGTLIYRDSKRHVGVLLLRLDDERAENRVRIVKTVIENYIDRLPGNFVVATEKRLRVRPGTIM